MFIIKNKYIINISFEYIKIIYPLNSKNQLLPDHEKETSNLWICIEFKNHKIIPTNYTISYIFGCKILF